jgi:hypothetical protein
MFIYIILVIYRGDTCLFYICICLYIYDWLGVSGPIKCVNTKESIIKHFIKIILLLALKLLFCTSYDYVQIDFLKKV